MRTNTELDYDGVPLPDGHHLATEVTIGTINFDEELGECTIQVYNREGDIPHFHLFKSDKSFECCICLYSPHYFAHGGKYRDKLNTEQCEQLDEWLGTPNKIEPKMNNWQAILFLWDTMNPLCNFPENKKVDKKPYYISMTDYKSR